LTRFHEISLTLKPFDAGLADSIDPVETSIALDWMRVPRANPADLAGVTISSVRDPHMEGSIYLGGAHNWVTVRHLTIRRFGAHGFSLTGEVEVDFQSEGVAHNELFRFTDVIARYLDDAAAQSDNLP
jgi:hypothetical protein